MSNHNLLCHSVRRSTHPTISNLNIYTTKVRCSGLNEKIPFKSVNPREPNVKSSLCKDIESTLMKYTDHDQTPFDLVNKGMFVIVDEFKKISLEDGLEKWELSIDDSEHARHGVLDGMHTYSVIRKCEDIDDDQYVNMTILENCPPEYVDQISEGLNRAREVQKVSFLDNQHAFDWIQLELKDEHYSNVIEYHENDSSDYDAGKKPVSVKQILAIINLFNNHYWDEESHPITSFNRVGKVVDMYEDEWKEKGKNNNRFIQMSPILSDILHLVDLISCGKAGKGGWRDIWNDSDKFDIEVKKEKTKPSGKSYKIENGVKISNKKKRSAGNLKAASKKNSRYHFLNVDGDYKLDNAWVYPIAAAFRVFTEVRTDGRVYWKNDDFKAVLDAWREHGNFLLSTTYNASKEKDHAMTAVGKSPMLWSNLYMSLVVKTLKK